MLLDASPSMIWKNPSKVLIRLALVSFFPVAAVFCFWSAGRFGQLSFFGARLASLAGCIILFALGVKAIKQSWGANVWITHFLCCFLMFALGAFPSFLALRCYMEGFKGAVTAVASVRDWASLPSVASTRETRLTLVDAKKMPDFVSHVFPGRHVYCSIGYDKEHLVNGLLVSWRSATFAMGVRIGNGPLTAWSPIMEKVLSKEVRLILFRDE